MTLRTILLAKIVWLHHHMKPHSECFATFFLPAVGRVRTHPHKWVRWRAPNCTGGSQPAAAIWPKTYSQSHRSTRLTLNVPYSSTTPPPPLAPPPRLPPPNKWLCTLPTRADISRSLRAWSFENCCSRFRTSVSARCAWQLFSRLSSVRVDTMWPAIAALRGCTNALFVVSRLDTYSMCTHTEWRLY